MGRLSLCSLVVSMLAAAAVHAEPAATIETNGPSSNRIDIVFLVGAAVLAMIVVGIVAEPIHVFMRGLWVTLKDVFSG